MKTYWASWWHLGEPFELHFPWWVSGTRGSDGATSICAAVVAEDEDALAHMLTRCYDVPKRQLEMRFVTEQAAEWSPYVSGGRFNRAGWMPAWPVPASTIEAQRRITEREVSVPEPLEASENPESELRQMFESRNIEVTDREFGGVLAIQTAMRIMHTTLGEQCTAKLIDASTVLDLIQSNATTAYKAIRAILGPDRYRAMFDTDETDDVLPIDPEVFKRLNGA